MADVEENQSGETLNVEKQQIYDLIQIRRLRIGGADTSNKVSIKTARSLVEFSMSCQHMYELSIIL